MTLIAQIVKINYFFYLFSDIDFRNDTERLYQEFVNNPFLIDNKTFTFGLYMVITSGDPLRVYINDDIFVKYTKKDYYPFDINDQDRYVTSEDAYYFWQVSLHSWFCVKSTI